MNGIYRLADLNIEFNSVFEDVHVLCKDYKSDNNEVDFSVSTDITDIAFEKEMHKNENIEAGKNRCFFSDGYYETLAIYRKISEILPFYGGILFHGSCIIVDNEGYLFTAASGTGKSTHARLWREYLGSRAIMLNDDKPLIRLTDSGAFAYGTPWDGKHRLSTNTSVRLKSICIIERSETNSIKPLTCFEAYPMLVQQTYRPLSGDSLEKTLPLIDRLGASVKLWKLKCNMDIEAAIIAYNAMKG